VRRLCIDCRQPFTPDATLLKSLDKSFRISENGGFKRFHELEQQALQDGIGAPMVDKEGKEKAGSKDGGLSSSESAFTRLWKANDEGCDTCGHSGYKGRIGIYEVLNNSPEVQKMIVGNSTSENIEKAAIGENMLTMQLDGVIKVLRGLTTIEEVLRVTAQE
jgi:type II secretory ATPase GspE/PulE/Tfp pilus assembly ATPase PilB-like protein